ncbi:MAG TPA: Hpt domain-containing protein [Pseudolabrys sp.]|nr:Hpt domain-containing protein [Pseudolabrys sp.]
MAQAAVNVYERAKPEALKVAVLDRDHLARMTFGDRSLEREVLQLFDRQSELLLERMRASEPAAIATLAHTLKGSAVGIGATRVASAAAEVKATAQSKPGESSRAIDALAQAVEEARAAISALIRAH